MILNPPLPVEFIQSVFGEFQEVLAYRASLDGVPLEENRLRGAPRDILEASNYRDPELVAAARLRGGSELLEAK